MNVHPSGVLGRGALLVLVTQLACSFHPVLDGPACRQGDRCPSGCTCFEGICIPENGSADSLECGGCSSDAECDDGDACTRDQCDSDSLRCAHETVCSCTSDADCDDGLYCTETDVCRDGRCLLKPRVCPEISDSPCMRPVCDEQADRCTEQPVEDGTPCPDEEFCTAGEVCQGGQCVSTQTPCPDDGNSCTRSVCIEELDGCQSEELPDGTPCQDGDPCTVDGACSGGICQSVPADCDDGLACTVDSCDPAAGGCQSRPVWSPGIEEICSDGIDQDCDGVADGCCLGTGDFGLRYYDPVPFGPGILRTADLDHDHILDLVLVSAGLFRVYLGQGTNGQADGSFQSPFELQLPSPVNDLALIDFDRDGLLDAAGLVPATNELHLARGEDGPPGSYGFSLAGPVPVCNGPSTLEVLDANRDGLQDLAVGCQEFPKIRILLGNPDLSGGVYFTPGPDLLLPVGPADLAVADVWEDGWPDLVAACPRLGGNASYLVVHPVSGPHDPGNLAPIQIPQDGRPVTVEAADLDRDGMPDLVTVDEELGNVDVYRGLGTDPPGFELVSRVVVGNMPWTIAVEDFDADAIVDFAVSSTDGIRVFLGGGENGRWDQTFAEGPAHYPGEPTRAVLSRDFDADGIPDLAFLKTLAGELKVLTGTGSGGTPHGDFHPLQPWGVDMDPYFPAAADLDGDGILDLAVPQAGASAGNQAGWVAIFKGEGADGRGTGRFGWQADLPAGEFPRQVAAGDLDRDGRVDLAVADLQSGSVTLMMNTNDQSGAYMSFQTRTILLSGEPAAVALADLDRDGRLDLVVADQLGDVLFVVTRLDLSGMTPEPVFELREIPTGFHPTALLVRDFNGDDLLDVAVACSKDTDGSGSVSIHKHTLSDGGLWDLQLNQALWFPSHVRGLHSCDFDSDGRLDLAAVLWDLDAVALLRNDGDAWFTDTGQRLQSGQNPADILAGDFNADGACDLAVSAQDASLTIWLGEGLDGAGTGNFITQETFELGAASLSGPRAYGLVAGRFNRDGFFDLAVALVSSQIPAVRILLGLGSCH